MIAVPPNDDVNALTRAKIPHTIGQSVFFSLRSLELDAATTTLTFTSNSEIAYRPNCFRPNGGQGCMQKRLPNHGYFLLCNWAGSDGLH